MAQDKSSARHAPSDAWFASIVSIQVESSVHLYYFLLEQFAAANCSTKLPSLDTKFELGTLFVQAIRFHASHVESHTGSFVTRAELARMREIGPAFWRIR